MYFLMQIQDKGEGQYNFFIESHPLESQKTIKAAEKH